MSSAPKDCFVLYHTVLPPERADNKTSLLSPGTCGFKYPEKQLSTFLDKEEPLVLSVEAQLDAKAMNASCP